MFGKIINIFIIIGVILIIFFYYNYNKNIFFVDIKTIYLEKEIIYINNYTQKEYVLDIVKDNYESKALILGKKLYFHKDKKDGDLMIYDLALGIDDLFYKKNLKGIKLKQRDRFAFWKFSNKTIIPQQNINSSISNNHIIVKDNDVLEQLKNIKKYDNVLLKGKLVNVNRNHGPKLITSTTRYDSGPGACEIFFVEEIQILRN